MSVTDKGKKLPNLGKELPTNSKRRRISTGYAQVTAEALKFDLGGSNRTIKTVMKWTGASERTVKGWLSGSNGPRGEHFIALLSNSDALFDRVLGLTGRGAVIPVCDLGELRDYLAQAIGAIDALLVPRPPG